MAIIASISVSFAAIVGTLTLVCSVGALIFLTGLAHRGTDRRIRRFTECQAHVQPKSRCRDRRSQVGSTAARYQMTRTTLHQARAALCWCPPF
jgi:hypothetical protein